MTGTTTTTGRTEPSKASVTSLRARLTGLDPITPLVGVVALVVYVLHGFKGFLDGDLGMYLYAGQRFADGVPPYVGVLNRAGPLAHMLPGLGVVGARIFGVSDVLGARILFCAIAVAAICMTYVTGRNIFSSRLTGLATAAAMLTFGGFIEYASNGPREKTPMVLFVLCVLWAVHRRRWMTVGIFISLATLCWQPAFLVGITAGVIGILLDRNGDRARSAFRLVIGGAIPTALCLLYFILVGAIRQFIYAFVLINAQYTVSDPITAEFGHDWAVAGRFYSLSLAVFCVGFLALLIFGAIAIISRRDNSDDSTPALIAAAAGAVAGAAWTFHDYNKWPDLFVLLPFAAIGIGACVSQLLRQPAMKVARVITVLWVAVAVAFAANYSVTRRSSALVAEQNSVDTIVRLLPPDATFVSIQAAQSLALSGKTNPNRFQMFGHGLAQYMEDTYPGGLQGFGRQIAKENPTVIASHSEPKKWLKPLIRARFVRVGEGKNWIWYVNRSVGTETIAELKDALKTTD